MISKLVSYWDLYWFKKIDRHPLGILRFALITYCLLEQFDHRFFMLEWANSLDPRFMSAGSLIKLFPFPLSIDQVYIFQILMLLAGVCAAIGFFTRFSLAFFTLGWIYLAGIESAWGWHDHRPSLVVFVLIALTVSPGIKSFSIDNFLLWLRDRNQSLLSTLRGPSVSRWGFHLVLVLVATMYFAAGTSKIRHGGIQWTNGETLSFYMSGKSFSNIIQQFGTRDDLSDQDKWRDGYGIDHYLYGASPNSFALFLSDYKWICLIGSTGALLMELLFPLILLGGWVRVILLFCGAIFHILVSIFMSIPFLTWSIIDLALIDWRMIWRKSKIKIGTITPVTF